MSKIPVGIIGCGYWGPSLLPTFSSCPRTEVAAVFAANPARLEAMRRTHGHLRLVSSFEEFLQTPLQAAVIATPVSTHFPLASQCLEAGLHVLVEKPLAATATEAQALDDLARRVGKVLMVDHTYLFGSPVRMIKQYIERGELGELYYIDSIRINL